MRLYANCYELLSEVYREVVEMGILVKPKSMQNKNIEGNEDYYTKEIRSYQYNLLSLYAENLLFESIQVKDWANEELGERLLNPNIYPSSDDNNLFNKHGYVNPGKAG